MNNNEAGSVKGSVLQSRLAFLRERKGEAGVHRVLERLAAEDRNLLSGLMLPSGWYPFRTNERLDEAIAEELGIGEAIFLQMGEKSASDNLGAAHRVYVHSRDPHGLLREAASIYRLYYDTGNRSYERTGDRSAVLRTRDSRTFSRADCLTVVGWHRKAIAMCGGKNARVVEKKCRAKGDELCEYLCEWE
jgi:uncharacterized protein (TIGR02265 family)